MSLIDKQISQALARIHREEGFGRDECRWVYQDETDSYHCAHLALRGRRVVPLVRKVNGHEH